MANKGLGRGLSALFGDENIPQSAEGISTIKISQVEPNAAQPRKNFDNQALEALSKSIMA